MESDKPPLVIFLVMLMCMSLGISLLVSWHNNAHNQDTGSVGTLTELFVGSHQPFYPEFETLGTITNGTKPNEVLHGIEIPYILYKIIECESNFNPDACNGLNCNEGRGLIQLISGTQKRYEKEIQREIDPFNPIDNIKCGLWLYKQNGTDPWGTPTSTWGSRACWIKYL